MNQHKIKNLLPEWLNYSETYSLVVTDLGGRYSYVNGLFKERFAFMNIDFIGQPFDITIHEQDVEQCNIACYELLQGTKELVKLKIRKPKDLEGNFYWTSWEFSLLKGENKEILGILCIGHDNTEIEIVSKQAQEFAQKIETIIEEITDGVYLLNRDWKFVKVNKVTEKILQIPREQLLGRSIWDIFPEHEEFSYPMYFRKAMNEFVTVSFKDYRADIDKWFSCIAYPSEEGLTVFFRNITKEHKTQEELRNSENKLKAILESTTDGNILISLDYKILSFNNQANEISKKGLDKELLIGANMSDYILSVDRDNFYQSTYKAFEGERIVYEKKINLPNFDKWMRISYYPAYDNKGTIVGVTFNTQDIETQKKVQLQLKQSEQMLSAIYNSTTEASTFIDKELIIRYTNKIAKHISKKIFGKEDQIGDKSLDFVLPKYKVEFESFYKRVLAGESIKVERKENQNWWLFSMYPVYDDEKNIIGIAHNVQDVTEQKENERQLQESESKLQKTIEAIPHSLLIVSEEVSIQYVNEEFEKVFGYLEEEVLGRNIEFLMPERFRDGHSILYQSYIQKGGKSMRMGRFVTALTKSGKEIIIDASLNMFTANNKRFIIVILQDVTELKQKQDTILKQNEVLRNIAQQQSHELRRPVANILGLCDLLENHTHQDIELQKEYIKCLLQVTKELDVVIHKIVKESTENEYFEQ